MISRADFLLLHSEFAHPTLSAEKIDRFLALAAAKVGPAYGDQEDDAHRLTTATMIARTPFGIQAKLVKDDGTTIYDAALRHLSQMCGTAEGVGED